MTQDDMDMLRASARDWVAGEQAASPQHDAARASARARWSAMANLGWTGAMIAEAAGGAGLGSGAIGLLAEELGRELVASPLVSTGLVAVDALRGQTGHAAASLVSDIVQGNAVVAFAIDDGPHHGAQTDRARATPTAGGWRLAAEKRYVVDGTAADWFLCTATAETPALFLVPSSAAQVMPIDTIDGRDIAHVVIEADLAADSRLVGDASLIARLSDLARLGIAAEMIGAADRALDITIDYLRTREQFGRSIGSFQALQHRAAIMHVDLVLARGCVAEGWRTAESGTGDLPAAAALAKFMAGEALHRISNEIVQMHGGIGMTAEHLAGRYLKWARVSEILYGGTSFLTDRYATASGY